MSGLARFPVYEIEHGGDEENAIEALGKAGCKDLKVLDRDYEGGESIVVSCVLPAGVTKKTELERLCPDVCF